MQQLFELSEFFLDSINKIGSFLLYEPFDGFVQAIRMFWVASGNTMPDFVYNFLESISSVPIGFIIFGGGLITILTIKFVSFITDLIT